MQPETYTYGQVFYWDRGARGYWMTLYRGGIAAWFCVCLDTGQIAPLLLEDSSFVWQ